MKTFNIKITEEGLKTIQTALEVYSRLGIHQFQYVLDQLPEFNQLSWDARDTIVDGLRKQLGNKSYGIHHPEVESFTKGYQIAKEIELHMAITEEPIMTKHSNRYDGALYKKEYLPQFFDEKGKVLKHEIELPIPPQLRTTIKALRRKSPTEMWNFIDGNILNGIRGNTLNINVECSKVTVNKPYRLTTWSHHFKQELGS